LASGAFSQQLIFVAAGDDWAEHYPSKPENRGNVSLKFSMSNPMKPQSKNLTEQNILTNISWILCLTLMTIAGTFSVEDTIASERNVPSSTPLLSKNSPPIDLSQFKCGDAGDIYLKLLIQNSTMRNTMARHKDVDSLSSQEKNALEAVAKLVVITDEGILDINNYNKNTKDAKDKDDHACNVLRKTLEESKPILEDLKLKK